MKEDVVADI